MMKNIYIVLIVRDYFLLLNFIKIIVRNTDMILGVKIVEENFKQEN